MMSFVACYAVSTTFHVCESDKETEILLQKLDHVAISFLCILQLFLYHLFYQIIID